MANDGHSRQGNPFSGDEINSRIIQGNNFSGTVVESLQNAPPSGPDAPDIVWGGDWRVPRDAVDGSNRGIIPMPRSRFTGYSTPEVTSPMQSKFIHVRFCNYSVCANYYRNLAKCWG